MTSYWDNWIEKIKSGDVTKTELIKLINNLHDYDHANGEVISSKLGRK